MYHIKLSMIGKINQKIQFFKSRFFLLKGLESRFNVGNTLIGTQMTSQIAGIDILHILSNENTYMKKCSKLVINVISIWPSPLRGGGNPSKKVRIWLKNHARELSSTISCEVRVVWSQFFFWEIRLCLNLLLHTYRLVIGVEKNFLRGSEVKKFVQNDTLTSTFIFFRTSKNPLVSFIFYQSERLSF